MKLVLLVDNYPPIVDGVGDYTYNLAIELYKRGHEVHVVCAAKEQIEESDQLGPHIWPIVPRWTYRNFKIAARKINDISPDWLLVQYVPYSYEKRGLPVWLPFALKRIVRKRTRILIRVHEPYIRFAWWPLKLFLVGQIQRIIIRWLSQVADRVVTSTDLYKVFIDKYSKIPSEIIFIPSNIAPFKVDADELSLLRRKVALSNERVISTFGIRDHELLVKVFQLILRKCPSSKLLVCGVVKSEALYAPIQKHVFVTGYLPSEEIFKYLKCSDVFFLPDVITQDGKGGTSNKSTSLSAALAADLPVIGIKGDMNNYLLRQVKSVYLEPPVDEIIADRIIKVLFQPNDTQDSYLFWKEHLSWESIIQKYNLSE